MNPEIQRQDSREPSLNPEMQRQDPKEPSMNSEPPSLEPELHSLGSVVSVEDAIQDAASLPPLSPTHSYAESVLHTLQKRLQESGDKMAQLEQAMRPKTHAEVFGAYVQGTLANLSERKFKKVRTAINKILEGAMEDSDEDEPPHVAPPTLSSTTSYAPTFSSSSPKPGEQWQPAPDMWKTARPPTASPWQSQDYGYMERYKASMINQMLPPHPPPPGPSQISHQYHQQQNQQYQFHKQYQHQNQQQHNHPKQQQSVSAVIGRSHQVLSTSLERDLADMSSISGLSALLETSPTSGQMAHKDLPPLPLPGAGEKQ